MNMSYLHATESFSLYRTHEKYIKEPRARNSKDGGFLKNKIKAAVIKNEFVPRAQLMNKENLTSKKTEINACLFRITLRMAKPAPINQLLNKLLTKDIFPKDGFILPCLPFVGLSTSIGIIHLTY